MSLKLPDANDANATEPQGHLWLHLKQSNKFEDYINLDKNTLLNIWQAYL